MRMESSKKQISNASVLVQELILTASRKGNAIHYETAIVSAGYLAGVTILRASGLDLRSRQPGELIESDWVSERVAELLMVMRGVAAQKALGRDGGWKDSIPRENKPLKSMFDLIAELEPGFRKTLLDQSVPHELHAAVAVRTAVEFIGDARPNLQVDIGKALAYTALVKAARTIPPSQMATSLTQSRSKPWWRFW